MSQQEKMKPSELQKLPIFPKPKGEKEEKYLRELEKYEFINLEEPGVSHQCTYAGHSLLLLHGGTYKFPRFLARHINNASSPKWKWTPDGDGHLIKSRMGTKPRFQMRQIMEGD